MKFQGGTHELFHLTSIVSQFVIALAVGQVKLFHSDKFDFKLFDLLDRERRESGLRFASEHLADEEREGAAVWEHGPVHDLDRQALAKSPARNQTVTVMAGTVAPFEKCLVLGWSGVMTGNVAVDKHANDFRFWRRALDPAVFVTAAKNVGLESHGRGDFTLLPISSARP